MARIALRAKKSKVLPAVHPNVGIEADYRRRLYRLIDEMHKSVQKEIAATYRANKPEIAQMAGDESPAAALRAAMRRLASRWLHRFSEGSDELAAYFAKAASQRSDKALKNILEKAGFTIGAFKLTKAANDIIQATIAENVALIKSIPQQYLKDVEVMVMQSVKAGGDAGQLNDDLIKAYGVTKRRAALISSDQNAKATSSIQRARQLELNIDKAIWMHSHAGKHPRPSHVANDGRVYSVKDGWLDPHEGKRIWPGQLINCFPGSSKIDFADGVEVAYRHWYSGDLTEIVTDSGKRLRATPNHPVLTPNGWIAIGALHEGDEIIEIAEHVAPRWPVSMFTKDNKDRAVPSISNVFDAVQCSAMRAEIRRGANFHGDTTDNDVDIVFATRPLSFHRQMLGYERVRKFGLTKAYAPHLGIGAIKASLQRLLLASARALSGPGETLSPSIAFTGHPNDIRRAPASDCATGGNDARNNGASGNPVLLGEGEDAHPGLMFKTEVHRIVRCRKTAFRGHVFNLQTKDGWYVTEGIVAHNCRCVSRSIVPGIG